MSFDEFSRRNDEWFARVLRLRAYGTPLLHVHSEQLLAGGHSARRLVEQVYRFLALPDAGPAINTSLHSLELSK